MRAEKACAHTYGAKRCDPSGYAQHFQLRLDIQSVARLNLDRCHPFSDERIYPFQSGCQQTRFTRRACRSNGRSNTSACLCNLFIARAMETHLKLGGTVTAMHNMRVAIDETRRDQAAFQI